MRIDENNIQQIYNASKNTNFKTLTYSERRIVAQALKALEKSPGNPQPFKAKSKDYDSLISKLANPEEKGMSSTEKKVARLFGAPSSARMDDLRKNTETKKTYANNMINDLKVRANKNDPVAQVRLGLFYYEGKFIKQDPALAKEYMIKGMGVLREAEKNNPNDKEIKKNIEILSKEMESIIKNKKYAKYKE